MKPNPVAAEAYALHTTHKEGDWRKREYLGLAESADEVIAIIAERPPEHYCLIASCVDGSPTMRLKYPEKSQRIGLRDLPTSEVMTLLDQLDAAKVDRRDDRVNSLDRNTLRERPINKVIRRLTPIMDWFEARQAKRK